MEEARNIIRAWRERYVSITAFAQYLGMEKDAIRTISNRRLPVTRVKGSGERAGDIRSYANINYMVQSSAREALVGSWMALEKKHPGIVWLPVHDELVLQMPEGSEEQIMADAEAAMRFDFRGVPITADAVILRDREGISRWMTSKHSEAIQKEKVAA
jgi:DNA polymerase-1